ncbi:MAG: hypothetical protein JNL56_05665 [Alphaproteobacteria bacterium]|nr:hypothetical protein [Alphaproteobacteria bacterium]
MRIFPALLCAALVGAVPPALAQDSAPTLGGSLQPAPPDPDAPPAPSPPPVETEMTAVPELTGGWILEKTNFRDRVFVALDGMAGAETVTILDGKQWLGTGRWWRKPSQGAHALIQFRDEHAEEGSVDFWLDLTFTSQDAASGTLHSAASSLVEPVTLTRSPCDFRYSDTPEPAVEGCTWDQLSDDWLMEAIFSGECAELGPCYRLLPGEFVLPD